MNYDATLLRILSALKMEREDKCVIGDVRAKEAIDAIEGIMRERDALDRIALLSGDS